MRTFIALTAIVLATAQSACAMGPRGDVRQSLSEPVSKADANNDGLVTREEFLDRRETIFHDADTDRSGDLTEDELSYLLPERARRFSGKALSRMDSDGDGRLSFLEWAERPATGFDKLDQNGDGILAQDEVSG